eukprot:scaffold3449_cov339-Prasinococcus_capsulatus_cf.AAC.5
MPLLPELEPAQASNRRDKHYVHHGMSFGACPCRARGRRWSTVPRVYQETGPAGMATGPPLACPGDCTAPVGSGAPRLDAAPPLLSALFDATATTTHHWLRRGVVVTSAVASARWRRRRRQWGTAVQCSTGRWSVGALGSSYPSWSRGAADRRCIIVNYLHVTCIYMP